MGAMRGAIARFGLVSAALAVLVAAPAGALNPEFGVRFASGAFLEVAQIAESEATADDLAFASRAVLAYCFTGEHEPDEALLDRARKNAEAALAIDPVHIEARLQLAIALSLTSRYMDTMAALHSGYGEKGKKLAGEVLAADPGNYYAHGFMAVWNVEVRRRGGSVGAAMMGASLKDAASHYAEAVRLAPDDVGVHWQYARALAALDARKYRKEIDTVLARALAADADDRLEVVMQARAKRLAEVMATDRRAAEALAQELL